MNWSQNGNMPTKSGGQSRKITGLIFWEQKGTWLGRQFRALSAAKNSSGASRIGCNLGYREDREGECMGFTSETWDAMADIYSAYM